MVVHIFELAYDDDNVRKFLRIDHNKNQHYRYIKYGELIVLEHNLILSLIQERIMNEQYQKN